MTADSWRAKKNLLAVVAAGSLAGCATRYEGKYDWDEGWRIGTVVESGSGVAAVPDVADDCRREVPPADVARVRYADVAYHSEGRWLRHRVVPVPAGMTLKEGQKVYVNVRSCGNALAKASGEK